MNTVKCDTKLEGATSPRPQKARPPRTNGNQLDFFSSSLADGVVFSTGSSFLTGVADNFGAGGGKVISPSFVTVAPVSYTHLRAHETREDLVFRLVL